MKKINSDKIKWIYKNIKPASDNTFDGKTYWSVNHIIPNIFENYLRIFHPFYKSRDIDQKLIRQVGTETKIHKYFEEFIRVFELNEKLFQLPNNTLEYLRYLKGEVYNLHYIDHDKLKNPCELTQELKLKFNDFSKWTKKEFSEIELIDCDYLHLNTTNWYPVSWKEMADYYNLFFHESITLNSFMLRSKLFGNLSNLKWPQMNTMDKKISKTLLEAIQSINGNQPILLLDSNINLYEALPTEIPELFLSNILIISSAKEKEWLCITQSDATETYIGGTHEFIDKISNYEIESLECTPETMVDWTNADNYN